MNLEYEILINQYGQDIAHIDQIVSLFLSFEETYQKLFLTDLLFLIQQSKPGDGDIEIAIEQSKLKPTYTPCVLLKNGVANSSLQRIIDLPKDELKKSFVLLLSLFKVAYKRRFEMEKNNPNKWWYWDLSDPEIIKRVRLLFN